MSRPAESPKRDIRTARSYSSFGKMEFLAGPNRPRWLWSRRGLNGPQQWSTVRLHDCRGCSRSYCRPTVFDQRREYWFESGSGANETSDGLDAATEALRHAVEDTPAGDGRGNLEKTPVFDRADIAPKI